MSIKHGDIQRSKSTPDIFQLCMIAMSFPNIPKMKHPNASLILLLTEMLFHIYIISDIFKPPIPSHRELFISQNLFGNHLFWKNCYRDPLYDSKLYLSLKKIKLKLNFHNTCFHIQIIIMLYKNLQSFQWLFEMETKTEEIVLSF